MPLYANVNGALRKLIALYAHAGGTTRKLTSFQACVGNVQRELLGEVPVNATCSSFCGIEEGTSYCDTVAGNIEFGFDRGPYSEGYKGLQVTVNFILEKPLIGVLTLKCDPIGMFPGLESWTATIDSQNEQQLSGTVAFPARQYYGGATYALEFWMQDVINYNGWAEGFMIVSARIGAVPLCFIERTK